MYTTVYTDRTEPWDPDEFPGCYGAVLDDGRLSVVTLDSRVVEDTYDRGEWVNFTTHADDAT